MARDSVIVPAWLDGMPLDSASHVRQAWHMIGHPSVRGHLVQLDQLDYAEADAVVAVMRRRIKRAAWEHGVILYGS